MLTIRAGPNYQQSCIFGIARPSWQWGSGLRATICGLNVVGRANSKGDQGTMDTRIDGLPDGRRGEAMYKAATRKQAGCLRLKRKPSKSMYGATEGESDLFVEGSSVGSTRWVRRTEGEVVGGPEKDQKRRRVCRGLLLCRVTEEKRALGLGRCRAQLVTAFKDAVTE